MLSYRHAFHAGNHADVLKHFLLSQVLEYYNLKEKPWWYIDTHAGAGCYALDSGQATKNAEFMTGISRLWASEDVPAPLSIYLDRVRQFNPHGRLVFYPGSPALAMTYTRAQDRLRLFELHPTDVEPLRQTFVQESERVLVMHEDGLGGLKRLLPPPQRRGVVLIDPSYEVKEEYRRVVQTVKEALRRFSSGTYMVWYPMLARPQARQLPEQLLELAGEESWLDVRLQVRAPAGPDGGMFGSGVFIMNPPWVLPALLEETMPWLADTLSETPGSGGFDLEFNIR